MEELKNGGASEQSLQSEQAARECTRLVLAVGSGDAEAEREFALHYIPRVKAMLIARLRNADTAADLLQEVMMDSICALRRNQLRDPSKLTPFVLSIARNVVNSHFAREARQPERLEFPNDLPDVHPLADRVEQEQRQARAMEAIATLDPIDKAILQMTLVEGLKPGIIAQKLGLSGDVVRQRKLRAARRLMELIAAPSQNVFPVDSIAGKKR